MIKHRFNYWSCGRFADWVRGTKKPLALTAEEWDSWRDETRSKSPWRFYVAEKFLNGLQNLVCLPMDAARSIRAYWENKFVTKTHFLKTGLKAGRYHELDERILHGLFNELKEFVEVDLALKATWMDSKKYKFKKGRCPEAGIDHLMWEMSLRHDEDSFVSKKDPDYGKPTPQAKSAKKVLELYRWWLERGSRPDPMAESGCSDLCDGGLRSISGDKKRLAALKRLTKMEEDYDAEDEKMLCRLIRIRKDLWT
jgi:hypothetical protein